MKESAQRIIAWAKAHPWLAALIVGAVILVGWFVYKRISSTGAGQATQGVPLGDVAGQPSTNGDVTTAPGALGYGGAGSAAPPVILPQPAAILGSRGGGGGGGGFAPIGDSGFGYPLPSSVGGYDFGSNAPQANATLNDLAFSYSSGPGGKTHIKNIVQPAAALPTYSSGPGGKTKSKNQTAPSSSTKMQTPSQLVGKGAKFTGWYQGVMYSNGFPVTNAVANVQPIGGTAGATSIVSGGAMGNKVTSPLKIAL